MISYQLYYHDFLGVLLWILRKLPTLFIFMVDELL